jgi:ribonuclease HI
MAISNSSSTTAEALAIQQAVLHAPKNFKLDLFTDSTSAISSQIQVLKHSQSLTSRQRLKIPNILLYEVTAHSLKQNRQSLSLTHVKAHTNQHGEHLKYNNVADALAKQAANPMDKEQRLNFIYYRQ